MGTNLRNMYGRSGDKEPNQEKGSSSKRSGSTRVLNVRLLAISAVFLLVLTPAGFAWHAWQTANQSTLFLDAAETAEKNDDWRTAVRWHKQYLKQNPDDAEGLVRLARAIRNGGANAREKLRAVGVFAEALSRFPERHQLRAELAELQFLSNPDAALANAEKVLAVEKENLVATRVKAMALDRRRNLSVRDSKDADPISKVVSAYVQANNLAPGNFESAMRLAQLYRLHAEELAAAEEVSVDEFGNRADQVVDLLVESSDEPARALLARHTYRRRYHPEQVTPARDAVLDEDVRKALQLDSKNVDARLLAAELTAALLVEDPLLQPGDGPRPRFDKEMMSQAQAYLREASDLEPNDPRPRLALAQLQWFEGDRDGSIESLQQAVRQGGQNEPLVQLRLAVSLIAAQRWKEADETLRRLDDLVYRIRSQAGDNDRIGRLVAVPKLLQAQWYLDRRNPEHNLIEGASLLREATQQGLSDRASLGALLQLGQSHASLGQWDLAVSAYEEAITLNPNSTPARLGIAEALGRAGRVDEAIAEYEHILGAGNESPDSFDAQSVLPQLAPLHLVQQLRKPEKQRDWTEYENSLARAKEALPDSPIPLFVEIRGLVARGKATREELIETLDAARERFADNPVFWRDAFDQYLRFQDLARADGALERFESLTGQSDSYGRARLALARGDDDAAQRIVLDADASLPRDQRDRILALNGELAFRTGRFEQWRRFLQAMADARPDDVVVLFNLAQASIQIDGTREMSNWEARLKAIEGSSGTYWRYLHVLRLLKQTESGDETALAMAANVVNDLVARRPSWTMARLAQGAVAEAQRRFDEAISAYRFSLRQGVPNPVVLRRLLGLLVVENRIDLAERELDLLPDREIVDPLVLPLAISIHLSAGKTSKAARLAEKAIDIDPRFAEYRVLLANALLAEGKPEEIDRAESQFLAAVRLRPANLAHWIALLNFELSFDRPDKTYHLLHALRGAAHLLYETDSELTNAEEALVLGRCHQGAGNHGIAESCYRFASRGSGSELLARWVPSSAAITGDLTAEVDEMWTVLRMRDLPSSRRVMDLIRATRPGTTDPRLTALTSGDPRLRTAALVCQGGPENRRQAIESLRAIPVEERLRGDDLLLSELYLLEGDDAAALEAFRALSGKSPTVLQWRRIGEFALDRKDDPLLNSAIEGIAAREPANPAIVALRIRRLGADENEPAAVEAARHFVDAPPAEGVADDAAPAARLARARQASEWLAQAGFEGAAETLLRSAVGDDPVAALGLAEWLSRRPGRLPEALEICLRAANEANSERATWLAARLLIRGQAPREQQERVERLFAPRLAPDAKRHNEFRTLLAVLREHQGRPDEAIEITEKGLAEKPNHLAHLNNLAWFLAAYHVDGKRALETVDRVTESLGPVPAVLDTRGVVLTELKRYDDAVRVLEASVAGGDPPGAHYLHLADAYDRLELSEASATALANAKRAGLHDLPPHDLQLLQRLEQQ